MTSLTALAALVFTGLSLQQTRVENTIAERGQITDRYSTAIGQLGAANDEDVRLGGIYALAQIMDESPEDQPSIVAVLSAYVRDRPPDAVSVSTPLPADVAAVLAVLGTRDRSHDGRSKENLSGVDFAHRRMTGENLSGADLTGDDLRGTDLASADLSHTTMDSSTTTDQDTILNYANLTGATLFDVTLLRVNLGDANLTRTDLSYSDLTDAILDYANIDDIVVNHTRWTEAGLSDTSLCDGDRPVQPNWHYSCVL